MKKPLGLWPITTPSSSTSTANRPCENHYLLENREPLWSEERKLGTWRENTRIGVYEKTMLSSSYPLAFLLETKQTILFPFFVSARSCAININGLKLLGAWNGLGSSKPEQTRRRPGAALCQVFVGPFAGDGLPQGMPFPPLPLRSCRAKQSTPNPSVSYLCSDLTQLHV